MTDVKTKELLAENSYSVLALKEEYQIGYYTFNPKFRILSFRNREERLSPKESELLKMLCQHINDILPRDITLQKLWGDDNYFTARSMDVFIVKLRKYLKNDPRVEIINVHGTGFRLAVTD